MNEEQIFAKALLIEDAEERQRFLRSACNGNEVIFDRINALLESANKSDSLLDKPIELLETDSLQQTKVPTSQQIGPYKLLHLLGEGGMGTVYLAEQQEPVKRRVAVKIIKQGLNNRQFIARFEAERQALAIMDHPNIAKVLDAGNTDDGQNYFVMEFVKGVPITKFCDENRLDTDERLRLFVKVCQAVQHAHQKGIIHRDLKPSNVMVAMYDDQPVPKVIDFGVAKATHQPLTEQTLCTIPGQIVGTWEYMSPEQAILNQLDVDTRTDIYSLGVILYEMLTGHTPLDLKSLRPEQLEERLRRIREQEPSRPSIRASSVENAQNPSETYRRTSFNSMSKTRRSDLDWLVMKALEKERSQRYSTASNFGEEINRFLGGESLSFRPPSQVQQLKRFVSRNKTFVGFASMVLFSLAVITGLMAWSLKSQMKSNEVLESVVKSLEKELLSKALNASFSGDVELTELTISELRSTGMYQSPEREQELLFLNGLSLTFSGRSKQAIELFDSVPDDEKTIAAWAGLYWATGDVGDYERMSECTIGILNRDPKGDFEKMLHAVTRTHADPELAFKVFDELVEKHKHWGVLYLFRAVSLGELAKSEQDGAVAQAKFSQAIDDYGHAEFLLGKTQFLKSSALNGVVDALTFAREYGFDHESEQWTRIARIYYEHASIDNAKEAIGLPLTNRIAYEIFFGLARSPGLSSQHPQVVFADAFAKAEALPINNDKKWEGTVEICNGIFEIDRAKSKADGIKIANRFWQKYFQTDNEYVVDADVLALDLFLLAGDLNGAQEKAKFLLSKKPAYSSLWYRRTLELIANPTQEKIDESKVLAGKYQDDCSFAYHIVGMIHLARGNRTDAIKAFSEVQKTGNINWWHNTWSKAFLERMDADEDWPEWILGGNDDCN